VNSATFRPLPSYDEWTRQVFGRSVPAPRVLLAASFDGDSEWGAKMHQAMCGVELEYVDTLLMEVRDRPVPGALVEFGIYQGWWINHFYERTEALGLTDRPIIGFDSFRGLSEPDATRDSTFWKRGMYAASRPEVEGRIQAASRLRIRLVEGWFSDSLHTEESRRVGPVAYARIDCDIYQPALDCLRYLGPRLSNGAVLVFDDWPHSVDHGEGLAFAEWLSDVPWLRFEFLFYGSWGHLYIRVHRRD
jgi:hypothetical protein